MKKLLWILFVLLALGIGLYPGIYFVIDRNFGLLGTKSDELLNNILWNIGFYTHIIAGGIALLIGWSQFNKRWRSHKPALHRTIGKIYIVSAILSAAAGIYIAWFATGGWVPASGFFILGAIWFYTTLSAFIAIKKGEISLHQKMMTFSYAAAFAAVTLRIWLPLLTSVTGDFFIAYPIAAWLAFVPNIIVAYFITRKKQKYPVKG